MEPPNWLKKFTYSKEIISNELNIDFLKALLSTENLADLERISPYIESSSVHPALKIEKITKHLSYKGPIPHPLLSYKALSGHKQRGVFASDFIPKGTELGAYVGEVYLRTLDDDLKHLLALCSEYTWKVKVKNYQLIIDPKKWANELAFINDYRGINDAPNVCPSLIIHRGSYHFGYVTRRNIEAKEELLVDYGEKYWKAFESLTS